MALHVQQQILDAILARLKGGATVAKEDVFLDRLDPLPRGMSSAIAIRESDNGETIQPGSIKDLQVRTLEVVIACALKASDDVAAKARAFGLEVEKLLSPKAANTALLAIAKDWTITASRLVITGEGDEATAARVQLWQFIYYVRKAAPDVALA